MDEFLTALELHPITTAILVGLFWLTLGLISACVQDVARTWKAQAK